MTVGDGYTLSIGFVGVDCESGATLLDIRVQALDELTDIYSDHHQVEDRNNIFKSE